jgi:hypothetical protein
MHIPLRPFFISPQVYADNSFPPSSKLGFNGSLNEIAKQLPDVQNSSNG